MNKLAAVFHGWARCALVLAAKFYGKKEMERINKWKKNEWMEQELYIATTKIRTPTVFKQLEGPLTPPN